MASSKYLQHTPQTCVDGNNAAGDENHELRRVWVVQDSEEWRVAGITAEQLTDVQVLGVRQETNVCPPLSSSSSGHWACLEGVADKFKHGLGPCMAEKKSAREPTPTKVLHDAVGHTRHGAEVGSHRLHQSSIHLCKSWCDHVRAVCTCVRALA